MPLVKTKMKIDKKKGEKQEKRKGYPEKERERGIAVASSFCKSIEFSIVCVESQPGGGAGEEKEQKRRQK